MPTIRIAILLNLINNSRTPFSRTKRNMKYEIQSRWRPHTPMQEEGPSHRTHLTVLNVQDCWETNKTRMKPSQHLVKPDVLFNENRNINNMLGWQHKGWTVIRVQLFPRLVSDQNKTIIILMLYTEQLLNIISWENITCNSKIKWRKQVIDKCLISNNSGITTWEPTIEDMKQYWKLLQGQILLYVWVDAQKPR